MKSVENIVGGVAACIGILVGWPVGVYVGECAFEWGSRMFQLYQWMVWLGAF